jgi:hypothetical protein
MRPKHLADPRPERQLDRRILRLGALAGVAGVILEFAAGAVHPGHVPPNDSVAVFQEYAASSTWTDVHIAQFAGGFLVAIALIILAASMPRTGVSGALAFVAAVAGVLVAAVFAVQMAVDGVALKWTIDAWMAAAPADRAAAFFVAESVRDLEKGLSGFFHLLNGTTLLAVGASIAAGRAYLRVLGWLGIVAGVGFISGGVATAHTGFSPASGEILSPAALVGIVFLVGAAAAMWRSPRARAETTVAPGPFATGSGAVVSQRA